MEKKTATALFPLSAWLYGIRTTLAVGLALFAAFLFQLQEAGVAATTVIILANPVHGLVLSKGLWRFLATLIGGAGSIALVALFIQTPEIFVIAIALWSGVFTALGSFLKHFRVYAAALTGYTVAIITLQIVDDPLLVFEHTIDRVEAISIGIISTAVVTGALAPRTSSRRIETELNAIMASCLAVLSGSLSSPLGGSPSAKVSHNDLMARLRAFETLAEAASHEPSQQAGQVRNYRRIAHRLASLLMLQLIEKDLRPEAEPQTPACTIESFEALKRHYEDRAGHLSAAPATDETTQLIALLEESAFLCSEIDAIAHHADTGMHRPSPVYSGDIGRAILNGIRSTLGALTVGYYWIYSGAPHGGYVLSGLILTSCLLATADDSKKASLHFGAGVVLANAAAIAFTFCLLPRLTEFVLLLGGLALFIIPGCLLATKPRFTLFATGYLIFFMIFISLNNVATFDAGEAVNTDLGWVLGALYSIVLFRTIFPSDTSNILAYYTRLLGKDQTYKQSNEITRKMQRYRERVYHHAMQVGMRLDLNSATAANPSMKALQDAFIRINHLMKTQPQTH